MTNDRPQAGLPSLRMWWLCVHDADTGLATDPVGVIATDGHRWVMRWVPHHPGRERWADITRATEHVTVDALAEHVDGIRLDLHPAGPPPGQPSLDDATRRAITAAVITATAIR